MMYANDDWLGQSSKSFSNFLEEPQLTDPLYKKIWQYGEPTTHAQGSKSRTQIPAVNQKLPPEIYFSQLFVTFAPKKVIKKCSGNGGNKKVILMYQPSTRMYTRSPA